MSDCPRIKFSAGERALLRALAHHKAYGIRLLFDRAAGRPLAIDEDGRVIRKLTLALQRLEQTGLITFRQYATTTEYGLSAKGQAGFKRLKSHQPPAQNMHGLRWGALTPAIVAIAGCASIPQEPARMPLMGYTTMTGLAQVRDPASGATLFVPCNPCAAPTPKTPLTAQQAAAATSPPVAALPATYIKPAGASIEQVPAPDRTGAAVTDKLPRSPSPAPATLAAYPASVLSSPLQPAKFIPVLSPAVKPTMTLAVTGEARSQLSAAAVAPPPKGTSSGDAPKLRLDMTFASAKRIVPFEFSASELSQEHKQMVSAFIPFAKQAERVYIRGRTDASGDLKTNQALALARAVTVKKEFIAGGVPTEKLKATYCSTCYVASNATEEGRKANRRVEIELIMPANMVEQLPHALPTSKAALLASK